MSSMAAVWSARCSRAASMSASMGASRLTNVTGRKVSVAWSGTKSTIAFHPMPPDDPRVRCPDITRAKQVLRWTPTVSRKEGLAKMIEFYRDQLVKK